MSDGQVFAWCAFVIFAAAVCGVLGYLDGRDKGRAEAATQLRALAAWVRRPGSINRDDAVDECARLRENNAAALRARGAGREGER